MACADGFMTDTPGSIFGDEASVPTPLRRRSRARSPITPLRQRPSLGTESAKALGTPGSVQRINEEEEKEALAGEKTVAPGVVFPRGVATKSCLGFSVACAAMAATLVSGILMQRGSLHPASLAASLTELIGGSAVSTNRQMQHVIDALACPGIRADILDTLAGTPYEFGQPPMKGDTFMRLPMIARRATASAVAGSTPAHAGEAGDVAEAEAELRQVVFFLSTTGGGWPPALKSRIQKILNAPCNAGKAPCAQAPVLFEVDPAYTSSGASWMHHALLKAGAVTGLPGFREGAEQYSSRPPSVVALAEAATVGDCVALHGNSSIALRVRKEEGETKSALVHRVVIEQPPRWAVHQPQASPRNFSVYGEPLQAGHHDGASPYAELLGSFEYALAAPATQAFELTKATPVTGLRFVFDGPGWGADFTCVYRLRAFEAGPSCGAWHLGSSLR